jgi:serine protease Do
LPAAQAGIKSGDIIIDVDGTPIKTVRELQRKIAAFRPDSTVKIKVLRDGKEQLIEVKLAKLPDQQQAAIDQKQAPQKKANPRRDDDDRGDRMDRGDDRRGDLRKDRPNRSERNERQGSNTNELTLSQLGISVAPATEVQGANSEGIVVTDVDNQGPAGERGLRTGDVILEIGGRNVTKTSDLNDALTKARSEGKSVILLRVKSQGGSRYVTLPVGKG